MPETEVIFYADGDGKAPVLEWLAELPVKVQNKVIVRIERLAKCGHELRRPEADYLRENIHELRIKYMRVNYRVLYFFQDRQVILSDGIVKEGAVPDADIDRSVNRRDRFRQDPAKHAYQE